MVVTHLVTRSAFSENNITFILKTPPIGGARKPPWPCHYGSPSGLHGVKQAGQDANDNTPTGSLERNYLVTIIIQPPKANHVEAKAQNSHSLNLSFIIRTPYCIRVQLLSNHHS